MRRRSRVLARKVAEWRAEIDRLNAEIAKNDDDPGFTWSNGSITFINCRTYEAEGQAGFTMGEES